MIFWVIAAAVACVALPLIYLAYAAYADTFRDERIDL
jgi:hypothetical protein